MLPAATATRLPFGALADGTVVEAVELANHAGIRARIITYGATLQTLEMPDRHGRVDAITLGYDAIGDYEQHPQFLGATIGRYANRIAGGRFSLDGQAYQLALNNAPNSLHGGSVGFDKRLWSIDTVLAGASAASVTLSRVSPDGEEGYPGHLRVSVTYSLAENNELTMSYLASCDRPTVINLTNHALFNLAGTSSGRGALDSTLQIAADTYTPIDATLIPTGPLVSVAGSAFDFRDPVVLGSRVRDARDPQLRLGRGIDHNFVIRGGIQATPRLAATLIDRVSGRAMKLLTTEPGLQVYSGNFLDGTLAGHGGQLMRQGDGLALEAQHFPDSPNQPNYPSVRLDPGQTYRQVTVLRFFTVAH
jgi:aldose 1-epimerase